MEKQNDNEEDVDNKNKQGDAEAQKMYRHFYRQSSAHRASCYGPAMEHESKTTSSDV